MRFLLPALAVGAFGALAFPSTAGATAACPPATSPYEGFQAAFAAKGHLADAQDNAHYKVWLAAGWRLDAAVAGPLGANVPDALPHWRFLRAQILDGACGPLTPAWTDVHVVADHDGTFYVKVATDGLAGDYLLGMSIV